MKFLKILLKIIGGLLLALLLFIASMLTTVDRTPYKDMPYYREWKALIGKTQKDTSGATAVLKAGWAKVNITPPKPTTMAGYGKRSGKNYESVHDSVYVSAMVLDNGFTRAAIVAADMLIIPPNISNKLKAKLEGTEISFDQVFLGATHTHSSLGGWGESITGKLFAGPYDPAVEERIAESIFQAILKARNNLAPAEITYSEAIDTVDIRNRLVGEKGKIDPEVRSIWITREDGQKAILASYAAHSTILNSTTMDLSRDYPGTLVDSLEKKVANFAMYLAGAVGSMGPIEKGKDDYDEVRNQAGGVEAAMLSPNALMEKQTSSLLQAFTLPLPLREPNPRIAPNIGLRSWVFRWAYGDYPSFVKVLRVGNILLVGMPCDFSGELTPELDAYAKSKGLNLMVTSFNGHYTGYITEDSHYDLEEYETITMGWYGPYNGAYLQEVTRDIIDKLQ